MKSCSITETTLGDFVGPINEKILSQRLPGFGTIELTYRCNLHCNHCYCNLRADSLAEVAKEISFKEICRLLDEIAQAGCLWLLLTGGEPLLRKDFLDIYRYAKKKGFLITLFTNATLITPEVADFLRLWPPNNVEITLYGSNKEIYESITGVPGSFQKCMEGIRLLGETGIRHCLKTVVTSLNKNDVFNIKKIAKDIGINFRFDSLLQPRIDGSRVPCAYRISPEEAIAIEMKDPDVIKGWREYYRNFYGKTQASDLLYDCGAGRNSFCIDPYGNVVMCSMLLSPKFNLKEYSFADIWNKYLADGLNKECPPEYACRNCESAAFCSHCPGWPAMECGDETKISSYVCSLAKLRKVAINNI